MNKNRPLPPPKPEPHRLKQEFPPALPPRDYENASFVNQQKVTLTKGNQIRDSKVQKLVQEFQGLITKSMNAEPDCPNNVINPPSTDDHIYDEVSVRYCIGKAKPIFIDTFTWAKTKSDESTNN